MEELTLGHIVWLEQLGSSLLQNAADPSAGFGERRSLPSR
jgi:hypothetical protein